MAAVVTVCTHPRKEAVCQKHSSCTQHAAGFVGQLSTAYWLDNLKQYIATKSLRRRKKDLEKVPSNLIGCGSVMLLLPSIMLLGQQAAAAAKKMALAPINRLC